MATRLLTTARALAARRSVRCVSSKHDSTTPYQVPPQTKTHTGQVWDASDARNVRFIDRQKEVNTRFAADLIAAAPVTVVRGRVAVSNSGGALGHPQVFLNLDNGIATCPYSGQRFVSLAYLSKHPELYANNTFVNQPPQPDDDGDHH